MAKDKNDQGGYTGRKVDEKWVEEQSQKHPLTFELITETAHDLVGLAAVSLGAPPQVAPHISQAAKGMSELGLWVATALEEAGDECVTNIETKVRERLQYLQNQIENRPNFTAGHAMQQLFGLQDRKRKIGFDYPADINPPS